MKRLVVERPGGYESLVQRSGPDPEPGPGQVRVRVSAAGVNYADCVARMGWYQAAKGLNPLTPGFEFAGVVDAAVPAPHAGSGAGPAAPSRAGTQETPAAWRPGDRVVGVTRFGAYTDTLLADGDWLWPIPEGWTDAQAAAFPAVHLTAWYGLVEVAHVRRGETVLVHSAAGGMGQALLGLGRILGCRRVGVVGSPSKVAAAKDAGAETVIDKSSAELWAEAGRAAPGGFDAIFDANGVSTLRPGLERLKPGGRLVVYGFAELMPRGRGRVNLLSLAWRALRVPRISPLDLTFANRSVCGFNVVQLFERRDLARRGMRALLSLARRGALPPPAVTPYPFDSAGEAHRALESGTTTGKLVLLI